MTLKQMAMVLALAAAVAGPLAGEALARAGKGPGGGPCEKGDPGHRLERMALVLDLSAAQKAEAQSLIEADGAKLKTLKDQARQGREALDQAALVVPFDEAKVRALAAEQAKRHLELTVARAQLQNQLHALLTPEQQAKAAAMQQQRRAAHGEPGGEL